MGVEARSRVGAVHDVSCGRSLRERALGRAGSPEPVPPALIAAIAAEIEAHCGQHRLKCRRLAVGWTVVQAVQAAHDLVSEAGLPKVGLTERSWKDWEAGGLPSPVYQDLLCRLFATNPVRLGFAHDYTPEQQPGALSHGGEPDGNLSAGQTDPDGTRSSAAAEVGETKRRDAVKLTGLAFAASAAVAAILDQAAEEAMDFTRQAEASTLSSGTLQHIDLAVTELNDAYMTKPPQLLFDATRHYRHKVDQLIKAAHTQRQGRDLFAYAGWLSELLAWLAHDLGHARAGLAFATDAYVHGLEAGHGELCAWAMDAAASINLYERRPAKALAAARTGLRQAPTSHPLTVRLNAQAARASAADHDAEGFRSSYEAAEQAHQLLPARVPHRFGLDPLPLADYALTSYPATACIWLGHADEAREFAERALRTYEAAPKASRSPTREAIARIDLALAHAQLGDPDDAVMLGHQALDSARVVNSVRNRAGDLTSLLVRRYPRRATVEGLHERLTALNTAASPVRLTTE